MRNRLLAAIGLLAIVVGCRRARPDGEIPMAPAHAEEGGQAPAAPVSATPESGPVRVAGIAFTPPASWRREAPSSAMRAAQFSIPGSAGEKDGEVAVYYFGTGQGGGVDENVKRWQNQFTNATPGPVTNLDRNGVKVTVVTTEGTYASGMPMGPSTPEPGFALWGAIIEAPQGSVFVKATGPKALIERSRSDFDALLSSIQSSTSV